MTERSRPWDGSTVLGAAGDAGPYSSQNWRDIWKYGMGLYNAEAGILANSGTPPDDGLTVQAQSPLAAGVTLTPGRALVQGGWYENDANLNLSIAANASGNPRIDSIILRLNTTLQTIRAAVLQGTPAASPVPPTLTRAGGIYEIVVADVTVANGFATIANTVIVNRRLYTNTSNGLYHTNVQNKSGVTLQTGDVVIWDGSNDRAVRVLTSAVTDLGNQNVAGVWVGNTAADGYGRVLYKGIGYVRVTGTLTRLMPLMQSNTAKIAVRIPNAQGGQGNNVFAYLLQATAFGAGNGLALCNVDVRSVWNNSSGFAQYMANLGNATTVSATFVDVVVAGNTLNIPGNFAYLGGAIQVSFSCVVSHSVANTRIDFDLNLNGVDYAVTDLGAADGLTRAGITTAGIPYPVSWTGVIIGSTGLVYGAANTITLRWKTPAATATLYNANVAGQDYIAQLSAVNLG